MKDYVKGILVLIAVFWMASHQAIACPEDSKSFVVYADICDNYIVYVPKDYQLSIDASNDLFGERKESNGIGPLFSIKKISIPETVLYNQHYMNVLINALWANDVATISRVAMKEQIDNKTVFYTIAYSTRNNQQYKLYHYWFYHPQQHAIYKLAIGAIDDDTKYGFGCNDELFRIMIESFRFVK